MQKKIQSIAPFPGTVRKTGESQLTGTLASFVRSRRLSEWDSVHENMRRALRNRVFRCKDALPVCPEAIPNGGREGPPLALEVTPVPCII